MTNKENVYSMLKELSLKMNGAEEYGITAQNIANVLGLQRNVVSHFLNDLNREGIVIKINTRPVYFIDREVYERRKGDLKLVSKYLRKNNNNEKEQQDKEVFRNLIGFDGSLKYIVEQCKSAVLYPPNGLPILLVGASGVGKSFLAQLVFDYAKATKNIKENSPFMILNCAEYANNPELLSSTLFGHCKGTYTGAESNRVGLIEEADGGILFLDEIHRLPPEGQEKLFLFLDKGIYRRLGESGKWRKADVRMIFATTENPENCFLQTFLRRIPLIVNIPIFQERPLEEKLELIYSIYKKEAINIKKDILVSNQVINILLKSKINGNIGKLTNTIKLSCANAFNSFSDKRLNILRIKINNLQKEYIDNFEGIILNNINYNDMLLSCSDNNEINLVSKDFKKVTNIISKMLNITNSFQMGQVTYDEFFNSSLVILNELIDDIVFNEIDKNTNTVIFNSIQKIVENILTYIQSNYGIKYYGNSGEIFTYLLAYFIEHHDDNDTDEINEAIKYLSKLFSKEYKIALNIIENIENNLDVLVNKIVIIFILIYIKSLNRDSRIDQINAIIIAHGYTTASSIAGVANRMLGKYVFESFDMSLETSPLEMGNKLNSYIKTIDTSKGLIILVDMGSLENVYKNIDKEFYGDIAIVNNISTQLALDVGNRILQFQSLEQIAKETVEKNVCRYNYIPSNNKRGDAIITTCITGIGTAIKIKDLLDRCFSNNEVKVIAYDYNKLKGNGKEDYIFKKYNVKFIIGTSNPKIEEVPYISLEDLIMRRGDMVLTNTLNNVVDSEIIDRINREVVKLFTLDNVLNYLTILNPDKIIDQVEKALYSLEISLGFRLQNDIKISLYIHICCMIERLVIKDPIMTYNKIEEFEQCHTHFIELVKRAFSVIEQFYKVEIPISEIGFIYDSINNKIKDFEF